MKAKTKPKKKKVLKTEPIPIEDLGGAMPSLHYELGTGKANDGRPIRFLLHVSYACFYLQVGDEMYAIKTEEIMNAMASAVVK